MSRYETSIKARGAKGRALLHLQRAGHCAAEPLRMAVSPNAASADFYRYVLGELEARGLVRLGSTGWGLTSEGSAYAANLQRPDDQPGDAPPAQQVDPAAAVHPAAAEHINLQQLTAGRCRPMPGTGDQRPPVMRPGAMRFAALPSRAGLAAVWPQQAHPLDAGAIDHAALRDEREAA